MAREAEAKAEELRIKAEQEEAQAEKTRKKAEAQERAKAAAIAAEVERKKRKEAAVARISPPPATHPPPDVEKPSSGRTSRDGGNTRPPADKVRVWHDRTGQFRVEAAFLGFSNGKLRLHKVNGVVVEVPSEKMSVEDMDYIEKVTKRKKSRPPATQRISEDDIPLGVQRATASSSNPKPSATPKKSPRIDWFDFFLSAGCDLDDCTRYAASFERDKIDESILPDITESTMRSLGLREGDIIRTMKAIEKRKPTDNLIKPSAHTQEQLLRDEELARKLQAQEAGSTRSPPPNLFTGPGGVLKSGGRKRPVPTKSAPATVDLKAIATVSDQIQRTGSPQQMSPHNARVASASVQPPPRLIQRFQWRVVSTMMHGQIGRVRPSPLLEHLPRPLREHRQRPHQRLPPCPLLHQPNQSPPRRL
ncbi:SLA1 homology domain 1, SHD1-domain-containing protein [Infundibulicybe gibba]|nr:SLA1 homology domain 1, SHD1-domain-containing protein [Infundibulicybe gibba]